MISVTVLTKNGQKHLEEVLESLRSFDEVLIYDTGSTDKTFEIAENFPNVVIHRASFLGFGPTHNAASRIANHDWILSIDSDEVVTPEMAREICETKLNEKCVYSFPRHNYFNGKLIKWCGWYPDRQYKLYNRKKTRFSDALVHESIITDNMNHVPMKGPLNHYSYDSISEFLEKMQKYSTLFAEQNRGKKKSSLLKAISHGFYTFFKSYFMKRGICGGYEGFIISLYNAQTAYYKYLKLHEANMRR